ncbi:MAG TPA: glycosyltransferase family 39 protein [Patescibacteria group bacterium]|nr:glycosyltransferase family 39 protein [Patescibacteria group bacterium]
MRKIISLVLKNWLVLLILLVAAFMRLYKIADYLTFLGDEGRDVLVVYNILHGHLTLLGPTSSVGGFFLGPIYYYIMAPSLWLAGYSPVGPAVMIALFGVVAVWLVYYVGSHFFNKTAGIIAAALFAINPLVILYSRSSWNPNLMPLTTLLMLFVLYKAVEKKSVGLYAIVGILYGIAMQLHYIEVFLGPMMALYFLIGNIYRPYEKEQHFVEWKNLCKWTGVIIGGFVIGWSPFLAFEARHGFNNFRAIFNFVFHPDTTGQGVGLANFVPTIRDVFFRTFARLIVNIPDPALYGRYAFWQVQLWIWSSWVLGLGSSFFVIFKMWAKRKEKEKFLQYSLLVLWFGIGILFFGFYRKNIYDYYFEFLFPVPALLVGGLISSLISKNIILKGISCVFLFALLIINIQGVPFRYPGNRQLQQTELIAQEVFKQAGNQPYNFALITGGNSDHAYRYFLTMWGNPPVTIQFPGIDPKRTSVTKQLIVVCESVPCMPEGSPLWEIAGFGRAQIVSKKHVVVVDVYKLVHYTGK